MKNENQFYQSMILVALYYTIYEVLSARVVYKIKIFFSVLIFLSLFFLYFYVNNTRHLRKNYYLYGFLKVTILFKMSFFLSDALNEHDVVKDTSKDL